MRHLPLHRIANAASVPALFKTSRTIEPSLFLKGDCLQAAAAKVWGSDAPSARMYETTGVSDRVVVLGVDHAVRGSTAVNRYKSATGVAASCVRSVLFIKRNAPQYDSLRPVASGLNQQLRRDSQQVSLLPCASGTLRHPQTFLGIAAMHVALSGHIASIAGIVAADFMGIETLETRLRETVLRTHSQVARPPQICAWARM